LFIELLAYLKKYWQVEICVMTATMPDWLRKLLKQSLEIEESHEVKPDPTLFKFFRRHRLHRLEGNLENPAVINFILEQFNAGKSVLVCANTVKAAQKILSVLQTYITEPEKLILLHSRFTGEDRLQKESEIKAKANAELQEKIEQGLQTAKPLVVVATQVIEVSLDLSFNRIVSEPAPLEALAQRFGRVNRRGNKTKPPAPVYVLTNATDDMINQKIYDKQLLEQTQQLIEQQDGSEIDEASLTDWLNQIYEAENIGERFSREVELSRQSFRGACINSLRAFDSDENLEETFDKLFDGMEVLPAGKLEDYKEKLKESALAAAALLVPISYTQFIQFKDKIQRMPLEIETEKEEETKRFYVYVANLPYSFETGLGLVKE
jgi:CRISPR-associated endonuclease/helicase Cas3